MGLASLKRQGQPVERNRLKVCADDFIQQAELYAIGLSKAEPVKVKHQCQCSGAKLRKATFTLSEEAIQTLNQLSQRTGIAKSRLIRIWLDGEKSELDKKMHIEKLQQNQAR